MTALRPTLRWAAAVAALMLAHQVAAKAVRDSFFLLVFPATSLPLMVMAAAAVSVAAVPVYAQLLARFGPARLVPAGFLLSAAAHVAEWSQPALTPAVAVVIYLHLAALGSLLLSGFWSLAAEAFDPITARRTYGRIAAAGTLGGIAGGLAAERMAVWLPPGSQLLMLAVLHTACAALTLRTAPETPIGSGARGALGLESLREHPHLKPVALFVVLGTASASILDFLFKSEAAARFDGASLLRFFAIFHVATQTLTFVVQSVATERALVRRGAGDAVSALPISVGAGAAAALLVPALPLFTAARGLETVIRGSLFRSGYELLFSPMRPADKRRAKAFLDVACDRAGDALGAGIVQLLLAAAPAFLVSQLLGVVLVTAVLSAMIGRRLNGLYARQVERRLVDHAEAVVDDLHATGWRTQPSTLALPPPAASAPADMEPAPRVEIDEAMTRLAALRSGRLDAVTRALEAGGPFDTPQLAQIVTLLAWDDARPHAHRALVAHAAHRVGMLVDFLLDQETPFAVRRRLPRVLAELPSQRAVDGLLAGLDDSRFEVRYRCGRALDRILESHPQLTIDASRVYAAVARELHVPASIARSYVVIDPDDGDSNGTLEPVGPRQRNVEYVFSLLATVLPRAPLKAAYRAIHSDDRLLRGLALDFLNGTLPPQLRPSFWALLGADTSSIGQLDASRAADALLESQQQPVTASEPDAPGQSGPTPSATEPSGPR